MIKGSKINVATESVYCNGYFWLAFFLLATSVLTQLVTVTLFAFSTSISRFHFPIALLMAWFLVVNLGKHDMKSLGDKVKLLVTGCTCFMIAILFVCQFIDFSFDGQTYHIPAMIALASGWNPFLNSHLIDWNPIFVQELMDHQLYIDHYTFGSWVLAATVYKSTGLLESGKVFNVIYTLGLY